MKPAIGERLRHTFGPDLWPEIERRIGQQKPQPTRTVLRYAGPIAASMFVLGVFAWAFLGLRDGFHEGPPAQPAITSSDGASVAGLRADVRVVPDAKVSATLGQEGLVYGQPFNPIPGGTSVVIRLDWATQATAPADAFYSVVVIDKNTSTAAGAGGFDGMWAYPSASLGWNSSLNGVASTYPWLAPVVDVCDTNGCTGSALADGVRPQAKGPEWIVATFPEQGANGLKAGPVPNPLVGVIYADARVGTIYWAQRVYG